MRRRRIKDKYKLAAIAGSMIFLSATMQIVPKVYADARPEVIPTVHNAQVDNLERKEEHRGGTFRISRDWGSEDSDILLRIAMAEAEGESTEGKALVMMVVLNRMQDDRFPGTISEVVFQPGQFTVTNEGGRYYTTEPNEDCYEALRMVMVDAWDESAGALYFESVGVEGWTDRNCEYLFTEGNHKFFK